MTNFQQTCPACDAILELPLEADGRQAICPACQHQFVAEKAIEPQSLSETQSTSLREQTVLRQHSEGERIEIESVFQETQTILIERRYAMFWPFLIGMAVLFVGFVLPIGYLSSLASTRQRLAITLLVLFSPLLVVPVSYAFCLAFALARRNLDATDERPRDEQSLQHWILPTLGTFLSMCLTLLCAGAVISSLVVVGAMLWDRILGIGTMEIKVVLLGMTLVFCLLVFWSVALRFWMIFPLVASRRGLIDALRESFAMTRANLMTSFYLVTVCSFLLTLGMSLMGMGLFVAVPLVALIASIAQRRICHQEIPAMDVDG